MPSQKVGTYTVGQVSVIIDGRRVTGGGDGDYVSIVRNADQATLTVGADGSGTRSTSPDKSAKMTLNLQQTSDFNDILQGLATTNKKFAVTVEDLLGRTKASAQFAWISKVPEMSFGMEPTNRVWELESINFNMEFGGNE